MEPNLFLTAGRLGFLFVLALLFALVEIEIEGADGWAIKLPTWYRRRTFAGRVYGALMSGKPLTGYHAVMFFIPMWAFHIGLAFGQPWSWANEARMLASYLVWNVTWDFLWFVLNPAYGWRRFRKGEIWWHSVWVGRLPIDYVNALVLSFALAALPWILRGNRSVLVEHGLFVAGMATLILICSLGAPAYQRWYQHMRRPGADER
jgi:hypothetical protein